MKVCAEPGCANLSNQTRCEDCRSKRNKATHDVTRKRVYASRRWRGVRRTVLRRDRWCKADDCRNLSTEVDHIVPLADVMAMGGDPFDINNAQGLCKKHHSEKTAAEVWRRT